MKCSYCGANADQTKNYCHACGAKLTSVKTAVTENTAAELGQDSLQETIEQPAASNMEFPKTKAVLEEIFGPEKDWAPPPEESDAQPEEETWDFPVTPSADWKPEKTAEDDVLPPVYSTAPLREDVLPPTPAPVPAPALASDSETMEEAEAPTCESMLKLPTDRSLAKMILLGLITAGIYPTVIWSRMVTEMNIAASRNDGKRTMPYFGMLILAPITLGVFWFVWMHNFCNRVGNQLAFRKCEYQFGARDFWLWGVLGTLILVGPFVFTYKLVKSMNLINSHYNTCG